MVTMGGSLLRCFCGRSTAPLTGLAYVLQRLQRFRAVSCEGTRLLSRIRVDGILFSLNKPLTNLLFKK